MGSVFAGRKVKVYSPATGQTGVLELDKPEEAEAKLLAMNTPEKAILHRVGRLFRFLRRRPRADR